MKLSFITNAFLVIALVVTGYFGAQALRANLEARQQPHSVFDEADAALKAEQAKPRFAGDIDGIFIAPYGTPVPEEYVTYEDLCGEQLSQNVSWDKAGELDLTIDLPDNYVLEPDDDNTATVACGDTVFVSRRVYSTGTGQVIIGRSRFTHDEINVAVDRPRTERINGRDVIIVEPLTKGGVFQNAYAWFPEPFGETFISANDLSQSEFTELVALVASSTR